MLPRGNAPCVWKTSSGRTQTLIRARKEAFTCIWILTTVHDVCCNDRQTYSDLDGLSDQRADQRVVLHIAKARCWGNNYVNYRETPI
jgi:hypothetical protein